MTMIHGIIAAIIAAGTIAGWLIGKFQTKNEYNANFKKLRKLGILFTREEVKHILSVMHAVMNPDKSKGALDAYNINPERFKELPFALAEWYKIGKEELINYIINTEDFKG